MAGRQYTDYLRPHERDNLGDSAAPVDVQERLHTYSQLSARPSRQLAPSHKQPPSAGYDRLQVADTARAQQLYAFRQQQASLLTGGSSRMRMAATETTQYGPYSRMYSPEERAELERQRDSRARPPPVSERQARVAQRIASMELRLHPEAPSAIRRGSSKATTAEPAPRASHPRPYGPNVRFYGQGWAPDRQGQQVGWTDGGQPKATRYFQPSANSTMMPLPTEAASRSTDSGYGSRPASPPPSYEHVSVRDRVQRLNTS